jgi:hypothetical protein
MFNNLVKRLLIYLNTLSLIKSIFSIKTHLIVLYIDFLFIKCLNMKRIITLKEHSNEHILQIQS